MKQYIKKNIYSFVFLIIFFIVFIVLISIVGSNFFGRFIVECKEGARNDGFLYFTVGKGICNGLKPYQDLFETKGPFTFYLCALGYLISGKNNFLFVNIFSFLCLIFICVFPVIFIIIKNKEYKTNCFNKILFLLFGLSYGLLLSSYCQTRAGRIYDEVFCSFYLSVFILIIYFADTKKIKFYSPSIIFASIFLCLALFTKEYFVLTGILLSLLMVKNKRDFIYKLIIPFLYAGIFGIIFMLSTGILIPYFSIYIRYILRTNFKFNDGINLLGSSFIQNCLSVHKVFININLYSPILLISILIMYIFMFIFLIKYFVEKKSILFIIYSTIVNLSFFFVISTAATIDNIEWHHSFAVAIPLYLLLFIYSMELINSFKFSHFFINLNSCKIKTPVIFSLSIFQIVGIYLLPIHDFESREYKTTLIAAKEGANYVDKLLNSINVDEYLYVGGISQYFFSYTKTKPIGPLFFQTNTMLNANTSVFCEEFKKQLERSNVVFVYSFKQCGSLIEYTTQYINSNFTKTQPQSIKGIEKPNSFKCTPYFRKDKFN